jgi:hypothetical protein
MIYVALKVEFEIYHLTISHCPVDCMISSD